jgi:hypothetical protein
MTTGRPKFASLPIVKLMWTWPLLCMESKENIAAHMHACPPQVVENPIFISTLFCNDACNEGCGFLVHGNNGLQMRVFFHHVFYVHLIEMNNPSFLACFQSCGICSIFLILCLKKMIKWTWKSWYLQSRYQMHCKSDPTSPFLLGREYNNCILSLELPVKSPSLHLSFTPYPLFQVVFAK